MTEDQVHVVFGAVAPSAGSNIIYSVRLNSGFIATAPASFGDADDSTHPIPARLPPITPTIPAPLAL